MHKQQLRIKDDCKTRQHPTGRVARSFVNKTKRCLLFKINNLRLTRIIDLVTRCVTQASRKCVFLVIVYRFCTKVFTPGKRGYFFGKNTFFVKKVIRKFGLKTQYTWIDFQMGLATPKCSFCEGDLRVYGVHMPFAKITKICDTRTDGRTHTHTDGRTDGQTDIHICGDRDVISASRNNNTAFVGCAPPNIDIIAIRNKYRV